MPAIRLAAGLVLFASPAMGFLLGCAADSKAGVGQPPAFIYKNVTVPMSARPPRGAPGLIVPDDVTSSTVTAHKIALDIPFLGPPGLGDALSVGWGDITTERALREGELPQVLYADANEMTILGIYTRLRIHMYGGESEGGRPNRP